MKRPWSDRETNFKFQAFLIVVYVVMCRTLTQKRFLWTLLFVKCSWFHDEKNWLYFICFYKIDYFVWDSVILLERTYYWNSPRDQLFRNLYKYKMQRVVFCRAYYVNYKRIYLRKYRSKQSCVWIDSIFEAQNICFVSEIVGLLESFLS